MRKRNIPLLIAAITVSILLALIILFAWALLWWKLFAQNMPDSLITIVLRWIRSTDFAKEFMNGLRQLPFYNACCSVARDSDGTLEPLKYFLGLMGCVSFVVGAINEVKSTRSFGMLMRDVIDYVFPLHLLFQTLLYAGLAVTGGYACLKNVGMAAAVCLLGTAVCFLYSLTMAWCLFVSPKVRERMVTFYIKGVMTRELRDRKKQNPDDEENPGDEKIPDYEGNESKRNVGSCVLDYAKYVGQQWTKGNILQIQKNRNWVDESLLINLTVCGLSSDIQWLDEQLIPCFTSGNLSIANDFCKIFPDSKEYKLDCARYVLFTKALHYADNDCGIRNLGNDIRRCSQIWEQLFTDIESKKRKTQMAGALLCIAKASSWPIFTLMTMGLLVYLGVAKNEYENEDAKKSLGEKISFLYDIRQSVSEAIPEENLSSSRDFNDTWAEIVYLAAGVIQWMVSTGCIRKEDGEPFVSDLLENVRSHMSNKGSVVIQMHTEKYVVLSYLLFAYENSDMGKHITAYIMQYLQPDINKKLCYFK